MLEGLSYRFVLALAAVPLVPLGLLYGWLWLGLGFREEPARWSLADVSDDGRALTISYLGSSCESLDRVETSETASAVRILVVLHRPPGRDSCDDGELFVTEVDLQRPLAGRELVDVHTRSRPPVLDGAVPWALRGISDDGRALTISYIGSSCDELNRVQRRETATSIEVKVVVAPLLEGGCVAGVRREAGAQLSRPLGEQVLIDPRTARPPPGF